MGAKPEILQEIYENLRRGRNELLRKAWVPRLAERAEDYDLAMSEIAEEIREVWRTALEAEGPQSNSNIKVTMSPLPGLVEQLAPPKEEIKGN